MIDTASYAPGTVFNRHGGLLSAKGYGAADNAQIQPLQREIVRRWMTEIRQESPQSQVVLVGHHPVKDLDGDSYRFIGKLAEYPNVTHYISGDTHDGHDVRHRRLSDLREANLGSTIDAPIEYALGGRLSDASGSFDLARYSLTPAKAKRTGETWPDRVYAESAGTFERCSAKFKFHPDAPPFAPLADSKVRTITNQRLQRPIDFFGLPYTLFLKGTEGQPWFSKVRYSSLYIYKINRLLDQIEAYQRIYDDHGLAWPQSQIHDEIEDLRVDDISKIAMFTEHQKYMELYRKLTKLAGRIEEDMAKYSDNEEIYWASLCSALFAAHRDRYGPKAPS